MTAVGAATAARVALNHQATTTSEVTPLRSKGKINVASIFIYISARRWFELSFGRLGSWVSKKNICVCNKSTAKG